MTSSGAGRLSKGPLAGVAILRHYAIKLGAQHAALKAATDGTKGTLDLLCISNNSTELLVARVERAGESV